MPELGEQMYCSQQICIPPTFPYLLRQFAKAAIRTQPNDLLKWSTTYFRCLSLNIPPPVKPRLEYPIPRDHNGMTPGWLRALLHQMQGAQTVTFKVLWDRWIGACLQHPNLIQILCLGGFDDNMAVPWLRFIALCAAHLTDSLAQSMILICEVLTEEPEGGSAMVPVQVFLDLYQFLARIDASVPQTLKNYYFLDKFLELYQEKIARDQGLKRLEEVSREASFTIVSSEASLKTEKETRKDEGGSVVSCPSVSKKKAKPGEEAVEPTDDQRKQSIKTEKSEGVAAPDQEEEKSKRSRKSSRASRASEDAVSATDQDDTASRDTKLSSAKEEFQKEGKDEEKYLLEDLERLKLVQQELMGGESDEELEKLKASILAEAALTTSQIVAPDHFEGKIGDVRSESATETVKSDESTLSEPSVKDKPADEVEYEDVYVDAVPGIGARVPEELIAAVCTYMKETAKWQHGVVMPRNIRHFECPPLEVNKY
ncbi:serine/threonine-protein phosphatase 4 regulatory subunit 2-like [Asbolus verrucosus]|uniref:Serine/threonine-protein phosphatase 4 regulatory subunit 2-like n=1 Tax=Asbolus verrucosus TaxID=1661398 RepID=A0A482VXE4_ASBVE|nr:serine/threonine-protein phosphatase 4 regulatory subunit 2-like [Asbolus verrucosus]